MPRRLVDTVRRELRLRRSFVGIPSSVLIGIDGIMAWDSPGTLQNSSRSLTEPVEAIDAET